jgi:hypothetical protein
LVKWLVGAHASYSGRLEFKYGSRDLMTEIFRRFPQPLEADIGIVSQIIPFQGLSLHDMQKTTATSPPPSFWCFSSSSSMALQSIAAFRLLTRHLPGSSAFWPVFQICNFAFINIYLYTVPPSVFLVVLLILMRIIVKYLTYFSFNVNMTNPIQPT